MASSSVFLLFFLVSVASPRIFHKSPNSAKKICPPGFDYNDVDRCFRFVEDKKNYFSAELFCVNQGSHLTSVRNMYDNAFVSQQLPPTQPNKPEYTWLGLTNQIDDNWNWVNGDTLSYTNWDPLAYPSSSPFNCTVINSTNTRWTVFDCSQQFTFVCGVDAVESIGTTCRNDTDPILISPSPKTVCPVDWHYLPLTNSCYKIIHHSNRSQAQEACQSNGANLPKTVLPQENDFIIDLIETQESRMIKKTKTMGVYACKMPV